MLIPVTVGTIVPVLHEMTTGSIANCTAYKNDREKLLSISTSSYYCGVLTGTLRSDIIDVEFGSNCKSQVKFCGGTAFVLQYV
jgi:hypothetical protein